MTGLFDYDALALASRLILAALLGALLGYERQRRGKSAGLRTHMLVALGSATFVVAMLGMKGSTEDVSRVVQGVAAGIGFIGAGAILKGSDEERIQGLTTAAGIWMTAALGVAAGMGTPAIAVVAALLSWLTLGVLGYFEARQKSHDS